MKKRLTKRSAQWRHLGMNLVAIMRTSQSQTRNECPERSRQTRGIGRPARAETNEDEEEQDQLATAGLDDQPQERRNTPPGHDCHSDENGSALEYFWREDDVAKVSSIREHGQYDQHRNGCQILRDADADAKPCGGGRNFASLPVDLEHQRGAGMRDEKTENQRYAPIALEKKWVRQ
ncbi:MAG: hypothetical protein IPM54_20250 [Polyangiaceae bacterium]|nr:hypothetical protein [Polyangiaceae bacterium]